jgi:hypothetical protein
MRRPKIAYKDNLKNSVKNRTEFNKTFTDIYITNIIPKTDFLASNEEEAIIKLGKFIPGKIYLLDYDPLYKNVLDFYDNKPIIICNKTFHTRTGNLILQGINLNFLPEQVRAQTLDSFYEAFEDDIQKSYEMGMMGKINLNITKIVGFFKEWVQVMNLFEKAGGVDYSYAYRNYIIPRISKVRYIEYQHWEWIPFLRTEDIVGLSVSQIYKQYYNSLKNI